jgi:predicted dehydrogenase
MNVKKIYKNKKIRVGIIGCGRIFKKHYEVISNIKILEIVAVCDSDITVFKKINYIHNFEKIKKYNNINNFFQNEKLDICVICTPSGLHSKHAILASNFVKNIILEKPLSTSLKQAYELIDIIKKRKCKIFLVKQNRLNKAIIFLKNLLDKKILGKIKLITTRVRWSRNLSYFKQASWRGKWKLDGGVLANQASHHLDLLLWLINKKIDSVSAMSTKIVNQIQAHDTVIGNIKFENDIIANVEVTTGAMPKNLEGSISIFGQKGTVIVGGNSVNVLEHVFINKNKIKTVLHNYSDHPKDVYGFGHSRFYNQVVKIISNNSKNVFSIESSIQCIELIHAMYKSSKENVTLYLSKKKNHFFTEME